MAVFTQSGFLPRPIEYPSGEKGMFFSAKSVKIIEESVLDPQAKTLVTYTRNLGYTKVMKINTNS
ncbi:putative intramitochondrial sorting protein family member [Operophtera brumata]|uniref:Putative intramitochondrial sorting protein family member n=1 Tax=Operophtera brumata TaxID=104452 RepID=A0A0L7LAV1_OPEBR|nr:putative intramitochondrial sorting protein family member [Operophtera brumata]